MTEATTARLVRRLRELNIEVEVVAPGVPMPTVALAAAAVGVPDRSIVKSLLFADARGGLVLAVANGAGRIDRHRLAKAVGFGKLSLADSATVLRATGYEAGGVAPMLHVESFPIVIDSAVMSEAVVYCGGGGDDVLLRLTPADIVRSNGAIVADISTRPTA